jgi:hypothetical protein
MENECKGIVEELPPPKRKKRLHRLTRYVEPLTTSSLKKGAVGAVGE